MDSFGAKLAGEQRILLLLRERARPKELRKYHRSIAGTPVEGENSKTRLLKEKKGGVRASKIRDSPIDGEGTAQKETQGGGGRGTFIKTP